MRTTKNLKISNKISAIIETPSNKNSPTPLVIFFHGFGTQKNEFGNLFKIISEYLLKNSIASLRINFNGYSSDGYFSPNLSIHSLLDDANETISYASTLNNISTIGICGFSLGAGIALLATNRNTSANVKSIALLSPSGDLVDDFAKSHTNQCFLEMKEHSGPYHINMRWKKAYIYREFLESLNCYNIKNEIKKNHLPMLLIAGSEDYTAEHVDYFYNHALSTYKHKKIIYNANHIFNDHKKNISYIPNVAETTKKWFENTLYLRIENDKNSN